MGAFSPTSHPWTVLLLLSCVQSLPCPGSPPAVGGASVQRTKLVCFITASSEHYDFDSLRTGLCTHLILIDLMGVGRDGELEQLQTSARALSRFIRTKQRFREAGDDAKFIVSIGGVAQKSAHFSQALKTADGRSALADELVSFSIKHGLDGIDIAWFYPAQFGGVESDRVTLVMFLRDLHLRTKACDGSLSLTVGVDPKDIEQSYDVPAIDKHVDFVNLLTGDYHNPTAASHISPLYGQGPRDQLNINYSVMSFVEAGLNQQKIVIMNSCYAYLYVSAITTRNGTACSSTPRLRTVMRLSYLSARELIVRESFQTSWDDMRQVPYGALATDCTKKWLTYNDVESVRKKAEYVLHHQLGGIGLFSVDEDDFEGRIGCGPYPMLRTMASVLSPEQDGSAGGPEHPQEAPIETIDHEHFSGYLTDPMFPEYYYVCRQGEDLSSCSKQRCPPGQVFDGVRHVCTQPSHHGGSAASSPADADQHHQLATAKKHAGEEAGGTAGSAGHGDEGEEPAYHWGAGAGDAGGEPAYHMGAGAGDAGEVPAYHWGGGAEEAAHGDTGGEPAYHMGAGAGDAGGEPAYHWGAGAGDAGGEPAYHWGAGAGEAAHGDAGGEPAYHLGAGAGDAGEEPAYPQWAQDDMGAAHGGEEGTQGDAGTASSDGDSDNSPYGPDESNHNQAEDLPTEPETYLINVGSNDNNPDTDPSLIEANNENDANPDIEGSIITINDSQDPSKPASDGSQSEPESDGYLVAVATSPPLTCRHPPPYYGAAATQNFAVLHRPGHDYADLHQQQPSNMVPRTVETPPSRPDVYRQSMPPGPDAVGSLMPQSSNTVLSRVVISPNAGGTHAQDEPPSAATDAPTVLITPKSPSADSRPSTSRRASRRKSRSRKEAEGIDETVDDATEVPCAVTTRKQRRSRERKTPKSSRTTSAEPATTTTTTTTTTQVTTTTNGPEPSDSVPANVTLPGETTSAPSSPAGSGEIVTSAKPTDDTTPTNEQLEATS